MKKSNLIRVFALITALCLTAVIFVGCANKKENVNGYCKVVLGNAEQTAYTVNLDEITVENGLLSLLDHLKEAESLTYECDPSGFLTEVGDVKQDASTGTYIYIYTSVEADQDVSEYKTTLTYEDMTLVSTGVGAKDMTLEDGAVIYIGTIVW